MKHYRYFFLLLCMLPIATIAQDSLVSGLARQVLSDNIQKEWKFFYLVDSSFISEGRELNFDKVKEKLQKNNPDFPLKIITDSSIINWCDYSFEHTKCVSYNDLPKYPGASWRSTIIVPYRDYKDERVLDSLNNLKRNVLYVPVKWYYTHKRIEKVISKAWEQFENKFQTEEKDYIQLSTPIFSEDKKYAVISIRRLGRGHSSIYKMQNGKWVRIETFHRWVA